VTHDPSWEAVQAQRHPLLTIAEEDREKNLCAASFSKNQEALPLPRAVAKRHGVKSHHAHVQHKKRGPWFVYEKVIASVIQCTRLSSPFQKDYAPRP
jgi:hypothetical protein